MKKLIFILSIAIISIGACKKKTEDPILGCTDASALNFSSEATEDDGSCTYIEQTNRAAYIHFTEDWCGPCGKYGGPTFDSCVKVLEGGSITCMKVYESSNNNALNNPTATLMENANNYNITSIPTMYVNANTSGVYSNISTNFNWVKSKAASFASQPVVAGLHVTKSIEGENLIATANIKFYKAAAAGKDYRLSFYVLEDNVIAKQVVSGVPDVLNYVHRNIWRASNGTDYKGEKINNSASVSAEQRFDMSATIALKPAWNKNNIKLMAVIWEVPTSGKPTLINSNLAK